MTTPYGQPPLAMPIPVPLSILASSSTIAIPSLDTIPGSATQTPAIAEPEPESQPNPLPLPPIRAVHIPSSSDRSPAGSSTAYLTPLEGPSSRRSSLAPGSIPLPQGTGGSYFPSPSTRFIHSPASPSPSRTGTPLDRPRPAPLEIPPGTPDEPLFSAYPDQGPSRSDSKKGRFTFPLKPAFTLSHPPRKREGQEKANGQKNPVGRRRANTATSPRSPYTSSPEQQQSSLKQNLRAISPHSLRNLRRRRVSIGGHEVESQRQPQWPNMAREEAMRIETGARHLPFSYQHSAESGYTLQSVSTIATVRPLTASPQPNISARRSSLATLRTDLRPESLLGLSNVQNEIIPDVMPHDPPPRRSSLDYGARTAFEPEPKDVPADHGSVLSASLTDTSASAGFFSTSPSSKEHPLSSATTSLSRSAKSSKEGQLSDEKDAALSAIRLQRSLEWEARQTRHRKRLEKKRMILLELVETEVAYMDDLKTLVMVYLPQLYALPSVSERTADLVARNARALLEIHVRLAGKMVDVLKEEKLGYEPHSEPDVSRQLETVSRKLASIFVEEASAFSAYNEYCAGSIAAATLVRHIAQRPEYSSYERRCQIISSAQSHSTLKDLLEQDASLSDVKSNRSRLHFRDFLIMPIQRVCRYPLLLNQLLAAASQPLPDETHPTYGNEDGDYDTGVDVERALGAMRGVAEEADEARRLKETEIKSATVIERLEPHPALSPAFLKSLGSCRLIGSLDVLHHHPTVAPLLPPVKVKYMGAFLYKGYLILAKVKKGKIYEAKHFLPLEVFELIDITEGLLPHSIRLSLRDHNFDLAASCETEKEVWASALCQARDESTVPPFELPASVSPFAARARRMSAAVSPDVSSPTLTSSMSKRHTVAVSPAELDYAIDERSNYFDTPAASPVRSSFGFTPDRKSGPSTILLRRASATQRLAVDRGLMDVFSESCSTARSKAQLHHTLFLPDTEAKPRESTMLRRRRSFLDSRQGSIDIAFSGEIRGSIMPIRQTRSLAGKKRQQPRFSLGGNESSTEVDNRIGLESADETATDFGTLTRAGLESRQQSFSSLSRAQSPAPPIPTRQSVGSSIAKRKSLTNIRKSFIDSSSADGLSSLANKLALSRRKTASGYDLNKRPNTPSRAKSMPVSPVSSPKAEVPPLPPMPSNGVFADESVPVWTRGAGFTNQMPQPESKGPWTSLRRSMSFVRDGSPSSRESKEGHARVERPRYSRQSTTTDEEMSTGDRTPGEERHEEERGFFAPVPRRRKSVRIFQTLSRFTPL